VDKAILYYTCNTHDHDIEHACRVQLNRARGDLVLGTVSREPILFGDWNRTVDAPRSPLTMHKQILIGLQRTNADVVFLCESDVLYYPSHLEFEPPHSDYFFYNTNVWKVRRTDGLAVWTDDLQQVSGCCASRDLLLQFYEQRTAQIERDGFDRHYEPGPKTGPYHTQNWQSPVCNLDIRHDKTLTRSKWSPSEFRNRRYSAGWQERDDVPGWGRTRQRMDAFLEDVTNGAI